MAALLVTIHVLVSLFLIFVILLQPGKGDSMGALGGGGGGGNASSVFGGRGSVTFLAKVTQVCAVVFMVTSLTLAYRSSHSDSVLRARRNLAAEAKKDSDAKKDAAPAAPAAGGAAAPAPGGAAAPAAAPAPAAPAPAAPAPAAPAKK